jgi:hypothetical protein
MSFAPRLVSPVAHKKTALSIQDKRGLFWIFESKAMRRVIITAVVPSQGFEPRSPGTVPRNSQAVVPLRWPVAG